MKQIVEKLRKIEGDLSNANGPFDLFGLFLREDAPDVWDLVVAASWIEQNKAGALREISKTLQQQLTPSELTKLSRVVIIDDTNPALPAIAAALGVEHGNASVKDSNFFGLAIKEAFIITSQKRKAA
jgi:hypothetical protein